MGDVLKHPVVPVRSWVAFPVEDSADPFQARWIARLNGAFADAADLGDAPPVSFEVLLDVFRQPEVRMGLPIVFHPHWSVLGGAA
ncbi:MAG: hypothetical protein CL949_13845 [Erythrobacter sp.]|nr:hypothetical protein [Erythrobacter sp.]|tara:strand:+ start:5134 stop:5388 length:255 start_codon:yes stop_codon:yes gene_type:complete